MSTAEKIGTPAIKKSDRKWQSDVIVDMVKRYGFEYIALNPGASYRGLHDSLVNYGENDPPMMLCNHEKIAVQIAHGYARASGKPMIAIVHNLVGLLHAPMGIYYAYLDRAPIFIMGATGPMEEPKRRPFIDWIHSASVQGEAIRHYVKWDSQPTTIDAVPGAFARAYAVMMSGKQGPIYMCYDAGLQEAELDHDVAMPPEDNVHVPAQAMADPAALEKAADTLAAAKRPVIVADFAARPPHGWDHVVELAETLGAAVWDCDSRLNFPERAPAEPEHGQRGLLQGRGRGADAGHRGLREAHPRARYRHPHRGQHGAERRHLDRHRLHRHGDQQVGHDLRPAVLRAPAHDRGPGDRGAGVDEAAEGTYRRQHRAGPSRSPKRTEEVGKRHAEIRAEWLRQAKEDRWDAVPMTVPRLALEVWDAIKDEDWVLTSGTLHDWARRLWNFDKPYRHGGRELGTGTQIGISLGVALAHRGKPAGWWWTSSPTAT